MQYVESSMYIDEGGGRFSVSVPVLFIPFFRRRCEGAAPRPVAQGAAGTGAKHVASPERGPVEMAISD